MHLIDVDAADRYNAAHSILLRTLADGLSMDLAVSPIIVAAAPGMGTSTTIAAIAEARGFSFIDICCEQMSAYDLVPAPDLVEGGLEVLKPRIAPLHKAISAGRQTVVILGDACAQYGDVAVEILKQIERDARGSVLVVLKVDPADEDQALKIIDRGTGLHRAHIPTARLPISAMGREPPQPILATGSLTTNGSKSGRRFLEMEVEEPYFHSLRFTLVAKDDQDDDDLALVLAPLLDDGNVSVRLTQVNGDLICTTDDIV